MNTAYHGLIDRYRSYLPVTDRTPNLSLNEGRTPLIPALALSRELGLKVYLKFEGANPTGSFKDRGMVMAVAKALEEGSQAVICASTGNTSASAAAYAARAGIRAIVLIPDGYVALGKLAQALLYGADVISIAGNFDKALELVRDIAATEAVTLVNSVNPYRLEGQKTAAFEICDDLGAAPDYLAIPVGNAGNISAYTKGFREYHENNHTGIPHMIGFQAEGAAPIVRGAIVEKPETVATAIRIGNPASWQLAVDAIHTTNGLIDAVTDDEILDAQRFLARHEGVFAEPASAASVAGLLKKGREGLLEKGAKVVCVLTGNGLKDPDTAVRNSGAKSLTVDANKDAVWKAIMGGQS